MYILFNFIIKLKKKFLNCQIKKKKNQTQLNYSHYFPFKKKSNIANGFSIIYQ